MNKRHALLLAAAVAISSIIYYLEAQKVNPQAVSGGEEIQVESVASKAAKYDKAKELVVPSGFINTEPFEIQDYIGKKVILVDFWTYSCINCQRTLPYITAWDEKYRDDGLLIVGVHTPEFEFEEKRENVIRAAEKWGVEYPIVQDNDYGTWRNYKNRYWPRKYIIDIDGYIVYDHIGEGAYDETEEVIQNLLRERKQKLGEAGDVESDMVQVDALQRSSGIRVSPETYLGSQRNKYLANGTPGVSGEQSFDLPDNLLTSRLYLDGDWNVQPEYAEATESGAKIVYKYNAKEVYLVARADEWVTAKIYRDGELIGEFRGDDVDEESTMHVQPDQLYHIVSEDEPGEHVLEIEVEDPGFQGFAFTFG